MGSFSYFLKVNKEVTCRQAQRDTHTIEVTRQRRPRDAKHCRNHGSKGNDKLSSPPPSPARFIPCPIAPGAAAGSFPQLFTASHCKRGFEHTIESGLLMLFFPGLGRGFFAWMKRARTHLGAAHVLSRARRHEPGPAPPAAHVPDGAIERREGSEGSEGSEVGSDMGYTLK